MGLLVDDDGVTADDTRAPHDVGRRWYAWGMSQSHEPTAARHPLPGIRRSSAYTVPAGSVDADEDVDLTLVLRRRTPLPADAFARPVPHDEFVRRYGADPADLAAVAAEVQSAGGTVLEQDAAGRRVRVRVRADAVPALFGTSLERVRHTDGVHDLVCRRPVGEVSLTDALHQRVIAVLGLDDRPQAEARFRAVPAAQAAVSYTPAQVGAIYDYPADTTGAGRTVAIIELGGGFAQSDLTAYFDGLGLPVPHVSAVGVDGAVNVPGQDPDGADGEVLLDIEVIGSLAPESDIVVYFAPNTDAGFVDAVTAAAHATTTPVAISISWGQSEDAWSAQARSALDGALQDAAVLGATPTAAAGDNGSGDNVRDGRPHVDFPASSPHALGCGGTSLRADPATGVVRSETVWNDLPGGGATGGGVSDAFTPPAWQSTVKVPPSPAGSTGRGVPDVAGNADPETGYIVRVDGSQMVIGGTSAVAPLWAALVARMSEVAGGPFGLIAPRLYAGAGAHTTSAGFRDIVAGDNGAYSAGPGWDACTGLGVPEGQTLLGVLRG